MLVKPQMENDHSHALNGSESNLHYHDYDYGTSNTLQPPDLPTEQIRAIMELVILIYSSITKLFSYHVHLHFLERNIGLLIRMEFGQWG